MPVIFDRRGLWASFVVLSAWVLAAGSAESASGPQPARETGRQGIGAVAQNEKAQPKTEKPAPARSQAIDGVEPLVPKKPRSAKDTRKAEAYKLFFMGRAQENEHKLLEALKTYTKALEYDPEALEVYRALIPLAVSLDRVDEAVRYAQKAVDLDPSDYLLLYRLAGFMHGHGKLTAAIALAEKALKAPALAKGSAQHLTMLLFLGQCYEEAKSADKAADAFAEALANLEKDGRLVIPEVEGMPVVRDVPQLLERFGQAFLKARRFEAASRAFRRAQEAAPEKSPSRPRLAYNLAQVYFEQGDAEKALAELTQYLKSQPQQKAAPYELLAKILTKLGRENELLGQLEEAAKQDRFNYGLKYYLADQYRERGQLDKAKALYEELLEQSPEPRGYRALAEMFEKEDRPRDLLRVLGEALGKQAGRQTVGEYLSKAIAGDTKLADKLAGTAREAIKDDPAALSVEQKQIVGMVAETAKQFDTAIEFYRLCVDAMPTNAVLHEDLGRALLRGERYKEAVETFERAIAQKLIPGPGFHEYLSKALELAGRREEAIATLQKVMEMEPQEPRGRLLLAELYLRAKQWQKAVAEFEKILSDFPDQGPLVEAVRYYLSNAFVNLNDYPKAEAQLQLILDADPNDPGANNDLGYLWADQGKNLEEAERMIRIAVKSQPDNPAYLDSLGWVLYKRNQHKDALKHLQQAAEHPRGQDAVIWDHLGDIYLRLEQADKAREAWQKAVELFQKDKEPTDAKRLKEIQEKLQLHQKSANGNQPADATTP